MKVVKIELAKLFEYPQKMFLSDSSFYEINDLDNYEFKIDSDCSEIMHYITEADLDYQEDELLEMGSFYNQIDWSSGKKYYFLTGTYAGLFDAIIKDKNSNEEKTMDLEIIPRFEKICLQTMLEKLGISYEKNKAYDLAKYYEEYVKRMIEENFKSSSWEFLKSSNDNKKVVCESGKSVFLYQNEIEKELHNFDVYIQGEMIPDIIFKNKYEEEYIIYDVKYKVGEYNQGTRSDRLQILAYAYMWNCKHIGHIFPEKENLKELVIPCENSVVLSYKEIRCNTQDEFKANILLPVEKRSL